MNGIKPPQENRSKGIRETLSWLLDILSKASGVRLHFYKQQLQLTEDWVRNIQSDDKTGAIIENPDPYCAAHANLIFLTNQTIEAFHGVITASNYISGKKLDLTKACSILLDPRNDKGGVISTMRSRTLSPKFLSSYTSIPRIDQLQEPEKSILNRMYTPSLTRFKLCCKYSIRFLDALNPVRNAYAHNYRFIFYSSSAAIEKPQFDEAGLGLLPQEIQSHNDDDISASDLMSNMIYVGFIQRMATSKLVSLLTMYEIWIYHNIRNRIWNQDIAIFPKSVPYLSDEDKVKYHEIRESFGYDFAIPKRKDFGKYEKKDQENMHKQFLRDMQSLGDTFKLITPEGKEIPLKFLHEEKQED